MHLKFIPIIFSLFETLRFETRGKQTSLTAGTTTESGDMRRRTSQLSNFLAYSSFNFFATKCQLRVVRRG